LALGIQAVVPVVSSAQAVVVLFDKAIIIFLVGAATGDLQRVNILTRRTLIAMVDEIHFEMTCVRDIPVNLAHRICLAQIADLGAFRFLCGKPGITAPHSL